MSRNGIEAALFSLLSGVDGIVTRGRRLKHWTEVPPAEQPALFMTKGDEHAAQAVAGNPIRYERSFEIWLYAHETDKSMTATTKLNDLLDRIDEALAPQQGSRQTLGGLVYNCWIEGSIDTDDGALEDQGVAIFTVKILTTT